MGLTSYGSPMNRPHPIERFFFDELSHGHYSDVPLPDGATPGTNMAMNDQDRSWFHQFMNKYFWCIVIVLLVSSLAGLTCPFWSPWSPWTFCKEEPPLKYLFEALFVASFLAATVDIYAKSRLLREVAHDLFKFIVGRRQPDAIQQHLENILHNNLVRHEFEAHYAITNSPYDMVRVEVQWSFYMVNYSFDPIEYTPIFQVEDFNDPKLISIQCLPDTGGGYVLTEAEIIKDNSLGSIRQHKQIHIWTYELYRTVLIPPKKKDSTEPVYGDRCKVIFRWVMDMKNYDTDRIIFREPAIGVKIVLDACPSGLAFFVDGYDMTDSVCSIDRLFLKEQTIGVRWLPRATQISQ